jgi:lactate permease
MVFASAEYGFLFGLWPIAWIIVASVFLYKLTVKSGQFEIIRNSIIKITEDQRIQVILIGFSFGAFLEGAAGFGAPVAITAAILVGLGFKPLYAAGLCLIANTAPVAFGALGVPIIVAGQVTGIDAFTIGAMAGRLRGVWFRYGGGRKIVECSHSSGSYRWLPGKGCGKLWLIKSYARRA